MYGSRKCGTHARVFSQTLEHSNSKHETNGTKEGKKTEVIMDKSKEVTKKKSRRPNYSSGLPSSRSRNTSNNNKNSIIINIKL